MLDIALLIGNDRGLEGTDNDLRATATICRRLGSSRVRVLRSPDRDALDEGLRWLAEGLRTGRGLLHYSGHDDPALLTRAEHVLDGLAFTRDLTVLLDCCRNEGDSTRGRFSRDRVLHATEPGQLSEERRFESGWQGAFTWALARVTEQWQVVDGGLNIANATLVERAGRILEALSIPQRPVFSGPGAELAFCGDASSSTTTRPDTPRHVRQIDGTGPLGFKGYDIQDPVGNSVGLWVSAQGNNTYGYAMDHEFISLPGGIWPPHDFKLVELPGSKVPQFAQIPNWQVYPHGTFGGGVPLPNLGPGQDLFEVIENPPPPGGGPMPPPKGWFYVNGGPTMWFAETGTPVFHGPVILFRKVGTAPFGQNAWRLNPPW